MVLAYLAITVPTTGKLLWEFRKKFARVLNNTKEKWWNEKKVDIVIYPAFSVFPDESCEIEMDTLISPLQLVKSFTIDTLNLILFPQIALKLY